MVDTYPKIVCFENRYAPYYRIGITPYMICYFWRNLGYIVFKTALHRSGKQCYHLIVEGMALFFYP